MSNRQSTIVLAALAALHGAAAVLLAPRENGNSIDFFDVAACGALLTSPVVLAFWAVFGPGRLAVRLPGTLWLLSALFLLFAYGEIRNMGEANSIPVAMLAVAWYTPYASAQLLLWLLRAVRGWRLERATDEPTSRAGDAAARPSQFTLLAMLGWTFAAASIFGGLRCLFPDSDFDVSEWSSDLLIMLVVGLLFTLAGSPALSLSWIVLASGRRLGLRLKLAAITVAGIAIAACLLAKWNGPGLKIFVVLVETGVLVMGTLVALVFAACGYRLRRRSEAAAQPSLAAKPAAPRDARRRFSLALASLAAAAVALGCYAPLRFELWRQAEETLRWAEWDMQIYFNREGRAVRLACGVNGDLTEQDFQRIASLTALETLDLSSVRLCDAQLEQLAPLTSLTNLILARTQVSDAGLAHLKRFPKLTQLDLSGTNITDAGLPRLAALRDLTKLNLSLTDVSDEGLVALARAEGLHSVDLQLTAVTADGAKRLQKELPNVRIMVGASDVLLSRAVVVDVRTFGAGGTGLARERAKLKRLHARGAAAVVSRSGQAISSGAAPVTDAGLKCLSGQMMLEELDLRDAAVTDLGLTSLVTLNNLKRLDLRGAKVTSRGCRNLAQNLPNCEILR